jgi:hypothetical protein
VIKSDISVKIKDKEVRQHNTPTSTLLTHIADGLYNGTNLTALDKIVLVDSSGAERDYTTSLTFNVGDTLQVTGTITASDSYSVTAVRTYGGTNLYFESSVSFTVNSGDQIQITITISLTLSGLLSGASFYDINLKSFIFRVLANQLSRTQLNIQYIIFNITNLNTNETADYQLTASKSKPASNRVSLTATYTPTFDWALNNVRVKASGGELYGYTTNVTGYANTTITYSDTITVST